MQLGRSCLKILPMEGTAWEHPDQERKEVEVEECENEMCRVSLLPRNRLQSNLHEDQEFSYLQHTVDTNVSGKIKSIAVG